MKTTLAFAALLTAPLAQAQSSDEVVSKTIRQATAAIHEIDGLGVAADNGGAAVATVEPYVGAFDPSRNALADVDAALAAARTSGKHVLLILGGDWCHDSIALNDAMQVPRTQAMLAARYEIVRVHVPFSPRERVLPVAPRFGIAEVAGTPTVLILRADGTPTNLADAPRWRNAASRKPAAIHRTLERAAPAVTP